MADEFVQRDIPPGKDCNDYPTWGSGSPRYDYIFKGQADEDNYPEDACPPWYHATAQIDGLKINSPGITGTGNINISGTVVASEVTASGITLTSRKPFDIPHPTKEGYRLRHVCLEGPESGVYFRGRVKGKEINLPNYWKGLVHTDSITVSLTPVGAHQDVIVKRFDDEKIYLQAKGGMPIDCFYHVYGERKDGEKLIVEYQGKGIEDYPGDNTQYTCNK